MDDAPNAATSRNSSWTTTDEDVYILPVFPSIHKSDMSLDIDCEKDLLERELRQRGWKVIRTEEKLSVTIEEPDTRDIEDLLVYYHAYLHPDKPRKTLPHEIRYLTLDIII